MAHPMYHSLSSVKQHGGDYHDYLTLHTWMDVTKGWLADCRHRLLRHHSWGIFHGEQVFGTVFTVESTGKQVPTRLLLEQHVLEDFGGKIPTVLECFADAPVTPGYYGGRTWFEQSRHSAECFGGAPVDYQRLHQFLDDTWYYLPDSRHQKLLHHSLGLATAVQILGATVTRTSDGVELSTERVLAEHLIYELGHVPSLDEMLADTPLKGWMCRRAKPLSRVLRPATSTPPAPPAPPAPREEVTSDAS